MNNIILIAIIFVCVFLNLINRIEITNFRAKQGYLFVNRFVDLSKQAYILLLRGVFYLIFNTIIIAFLLKCINFNLTKVLNVTGLFDINLIIYFILSIIISFKMFFLTSILIAFLLLKKDLRKLISSISWIELKEDFGLYTKLIRPIFIGIIEGVIYCVILNIVFTDFLGIKFLYASLVISLIYGLGKVFIEKSLENKIIMFVFGFWLCFLGNLLYGFTESFVYPSLLFIISINFWVFKR